MKADLKIIDSMVFNQIKTKVIEKYGTELSMTDKNFSTVDNEPTKDNAFPFVYVSMISGIETANDLEHNKFRGGSFTYQINVWDNVSQARAKKVMDCVTDVMKSMSFNSTSLPIFSNTNSIIVQIARWHRNIDDGDSL